MSLLIAQQSTWGELGDVHYQAQSSDHIFIGFLLSPDLHGNLNSIWQRSHCWPRQTQPELSVERRKKIFKIILNTKPKKKIIFLLLFGNLLMLRQKKKSVIVCHQPRKQKKNENIDETREHDIAIAPTSAKLTFLIFMNFRRESLSTPHFVISRESS